MSTTVEPVDQADVWDRLNVLWHGLFAATVALPTLLAVSDPSTSTRSRLLVLTGAAVLVTAHWLVVARHPQWWERRLGRLALYWLLPCGLVAMLATQHPSFVITLYGLYPLMFITLGWWGIVPIVGVTAIVGWALGGWGSGPAMITNLLTTAGLALVIAFFVQAISKQSEQRRDALTALAATRAELAESARQTGILAERERLARELHDTVAQGFASVVTQLESAEQALDEVRGRELADAHAQVAREHLAQARRTARESLDEIRQSVRALRPDLLADRSLPEALRKAVERWRARSGVPAELRVTGTPTALPEDTELALFRAAQEALTNVSRHASAHRVVVSLSYLGDLVTLDIDDDGVGISSPGRPQSDGGFGLIAMRERVTAAGGELIIESAAGEGTTIAVSVPTGASA
jgi:signal transduction histidine kinase